MISLLMYQWKSYIIFKFCNCKIYFKRIFQIRIQIYLFKQTSRKRSYYWFFIVTYHILKELIYELYLEICKIKSSVVVAIKLVCEINYDFISETFFLRIQKLFYKSIANELYLLMTCNKTVKFHYNMVLWVKICYVLMLIAHKDTL